MKKYIFLLLGMCITYPLLSVCAEEEKKSWVEEIRIVKTGNKAFDRQLEESVNLYLCNKAKEQVNCKNYYSNEDNFLPVEQKITFVDPLGIDATRKIVNEFYALHGYPSYTSRHYDEAQLLEVGSVLKAVKLRLQEQGNNKKIDSSLIFTAANSFYDAGKPGWFDSHYYASIPIALWYIHQKSPEKSIALYDEFAYLLQSSNKDPHKVAGGNIINNPNYRNHELLNADIAVYSTLFPANWNPNGFNSNKAETKILNVDTALSRIECFPSMCSPEGGPPSRTMKASGSHVPVDREKNALMCAKDGRGEGYTPDGIRAWRGSEGSIAIFSVDKKAENWNEIIEFITLRMHYWTAANDCVKGHRGDHNRRVIQKPSLEKTVKQQVPYKKAWLIKVGGISVLLIISALGLFFWSHNNKLSKWL